MTRDLSPFWIALIGMALCGGLVWLGSVLIGR
jgi:hypothetical protein